MRNLKVCLIGPNEAGKSVLAKRIAHCDIEPEYIETIGVDLTTFIEDDCRVMLWDTAGNQRYRKIITTYVKPCPMIFLVFSFSNFRKSFNAMKKIVDEFYNILVNKNLLLVGTHSDEYEYNFHDVKEANQFATSMNCEFFPTTLHNIKTTNLVRYYILDYAAKNCEDEGLKKEKSMRDLCKVDGKRCTLM